MRRAMLSVSDPATLAGATQGREREERGESVLSAVEQGPQELADRTFHGGSIRAGGAVDSTCGVCAVSRRRGRNIPQWRRSKEAPLARCAEGPVVLGRVEGRLRRPLRDRSLDPPCARSESRAVPSAGTTLRSLRSACWHEAWPW